MREINPAAWPNGTLASWLSAKEHCDAHCVVYTVAVLVISTSVLYQHAQHIINLDVSMHFVGACLDCCPATSTEK